MKKLTKIGTYLFSLLVLICIFLAVLLLIAHSRQPNITNPRPTNEQTSRSVPEKKTKLTHLTVVGIGDSLTFGVGTSTPKKDYMHQLKQKLLQNDAKKVTTYNFGKPGDTTNDIQARLNSQPQIQKSLKTSNIIVMTAGGNDLMHALQDNFQTISSNRFSTSMKNAQASYQLHMTELLKDVRQTNDHAPIFLFSVYDPFYVYFPNMTALEKYTQQWNQIAEEQTQQLSSTYFVDVGAKLSQGQYYGKSKTRLKKQDSSDLGAVSDKNLVKILSNDQEKNAFLSPNDHFHPNDRGYKLMSVNLYQNMSKHKETWFKEE